MFRIKYLIDLDSYLDKSTEIEQRKIVKQLKYLAEFGLRSEILNTKKMKGYEFWEIRIRGKHNVRMFCIQRQDIVYVLHIFNKKKNKTNKKDLKYANNQLSLIDNYI